MVWLLFNIVQNRYASFVHPYILNFSFLLLLFDRCHCVQLANTTSAAGRVVSGYEDGSLCLWEVEVGRFMCMLICWIFVFY